MRGGLGFGVEGERRGSWGMLAGYRIWCSHGKSVTEQKDGRNGTMGMRNARIRSPDELRGNPNLISPMRSSLNQSLGTPRSAHTLSHCSQLLIYTGGRSSGCRIRRVYTNLPSGSLGSNSVTMWGGLYSVQKCPACWGDWSNHEGRQCSVEFSLKEVRTRRSFWRRRRRGFASTWA